MSSVVVQSKSRFAQRLDYEQSLFFLIIRRERSEKNKAARKLVARQAKKELSRGLFFFSLRSRLACVTAKTGV